MRYAVDATAGVVEKSALSSVGAALDGKQAATADRASFEQDARLSCRPQNWGHRYCARDKSVRLWAARQSFSRREATL